jgi:predicted dehydrogenase
VKLGLLSTAPINSALLETRAQSDSFDVVAVGSRDRTRAEAYAQEWGIAAAHSS